MQRTLGILLAVVLLGCAGGATTPGGYAFGVAIGDAQFANCPEKQTSEGIAVRPEFTACITNTGGNLGAGMVSIATALFNAALSLVGKALPGAQ